MSLNSVKRSDSDQIFTGLSTDTKPTITAKARNTFLETDTGNTFEFSGGDWYPKGTVGAQNINLKGSGPVSPNYNRNINLAATTHPEDGNNNVAEFLPSLGIREVTITAPVVASFTGLLVVWNAPTHPIAKLWLDSISASSVQYDFVAPGETRVFTFTNDIFQADVLPLGAAARIIVEGA